MIVRYKHMYCQKDYEVHTNGLVKPCCMAFLLKVKTFPSQSHVYVHTCVLKGSRMMYVSMWMDVHTVVPTPKN